MKTTCPRCGATLPAENASCPRCLFDLALAEPSGDPSVPGSAISSARRPRTPPPTPAELAPLFPELEIEFLIGEGGMGAVYRARQRRLGRTVALKVLQQEFSKDPVFSERFLREAQALAKLAHPGIVAVHDFGEREGRCYLVMEYVDGANLRALLKTGTLVSRQALDIVRQLCDALQFAHDEGVVHRDIKPENVLVDRAGRVKIADFGLAKLLGAPAQESLTSAGQVMGTPHYMAPEQVEHPRDVDHRADLFSLGVVFYEMLTGELPLGRFAPPSQRVQIDVRLDEIVLKSLERERERRYQHAIEVRTDVETVERGPAAPAPAAAPKMERAPRGPRRRVLPKGVYVGLVGRLERPEGPRAARQPGNWIIGVHGAPAWLVLFAGAWVLAGLSFNWGPLPFALVSLTLLGALFFSLAVSRRSHEAQAAWAALPRAERVGRWTGSVLLFLLGSLALFGAHVASWERGTKNYVPNESSPEALVQEWQRVLAAESKGAPLEIEVERSFALSNAYVPFGMTPLLVAGLSVVLLLVALRSLDGRGFDPSARTRPWRAALHSLALVLLPLLPWDYSQLMKNERTSTRIARVGMASSMEDPVDEVAQRTYAAFIQRFFQVQNQIFVQAVSPSSRETVATGQVLVSGPASPFDRWRLRWSGPERLQPSVQAFVQRWEGQHPTTVRLDAGMVDPSSPEKGAWERELDELLDECRSGD